MAGKRGGDRYKHKLTRKQDTFARLVAEGSTKTEAFKHAYDCENSQPATIRTMAHQLSRNLKVARAIEQYENELHYRTMTESEITRELVRNHLLQIGTDPNVSPAARVAALVALGKAVGFFTPEKTEPPAFATHEEAQETLVNALDRLRSDPKIISLIDAKRR